MQHKTWEPGNGTRYELVMYPNTDSVFGYDVNTVTVIGPFPHKVQVMILYADYPVHYQDVMLAWGLNEHDASMIALLASHMLGTTGVPTLAPWFVVRNPLS